MSDHVHAARARLTELKPRLEGLQSGLTKLQTLRGRLSSELESKRSEVLHLTDEVLVLSKVEELFRTLMDNMVVEQVRTIEPIVTEGLRTIFANQDMTFEAKIGVRNSKVSIDFFIRQGKDDLMAVRGDPLESFGGGPAAVASLLLRVLAMLKLGRSPLLLLDETLSGVSDEYVDATGAFLKTLAAKVGVPMLVVTHKQAFLDHADTAYRGVEVTHDDGTWSLSLRRV